MWMHQELGLDIGCVRVTARRLPRAVGGTRTPPDMEDRAAKYVPEGNLILINADFRGFADMVGRWLGRYPATPGAGLVVGDTVREWFEQALLETVLRVRPLAGSRRWSVEDVGRAPSEEALTAAVMQRYHVDAACKRALMRKLGSFDGAWGRSPRRSAILRSL